MAEFRASVGTELDLRGFDLNDEWATLPNEAEAFQSVDTLRLGNLPKARLKTFVSFAARLPRLRHLICSNSMNDRKLRAIAELSRLEALSIVECSKVTDAGIEVVAGRMRGLTRLNISQCWQVTDASAMAVAEHLPNLAKLSLAGCDQVTDAGVLAVAKRLTGLTELNLNGCNRVTDIGVAAVAKGLAGLVVLRLGRLALLTNAAVKSIAANLTHLTKLSLDNCTEVTDAGVKEVARRLTELTELNLAGCDEVKDAGVKAIAQRLTGLTKLNLRGCPQVTDAGIKAIAKTLTRATALNLSQCVEVTDVGVTALASSLIRLTEFSLRGCYQVTDVGVTAIAKNLSGLSKLNLSGCNRVTDAGVKAVAERLTGVTELNLARCGGVTDAGVKAVSKTLINVTKLNLDLCGQVTDSGVEAVAKSLTELTELSLSGCVHVTDAGVTAVAKCLTHLTVLGLEGCARVTNAGVAALADNLDSLTELSLSGLRHVTGHSLRKLGEAYQAGRLKLRRLDVHGTQSGLSEEVIRSGRAPTIFRALLAENSTQLREAKLLLVGDGEVGKSHLKDRLDGTPQAFDARKDRTHDIDFRLWPATGARPRTRLWDFGGQPHLHGSHRFFLGADHSGYILVLDATRTTAANHLNYWLRFISHYGRSARAGERAPVVIVVNKCDVVTLAGSEEFRTKWLHAARIRENYEDLCTGLRAAEEANWHGANVLRGPIHGLGHFPRARRDYQDDSWLGTLPGEVPKRLHDDILARHTRTMEGIKTRITEALNSVPSPSVGYPPEFHRMKDYLEGELTESVSSKAPKSWVNAQTESWRAEVIERFGIRTDEVEMWLKTLRSLGIIHWVGDFDAVERGEHPTIRHRLFNPHWVKGPVYELIQTRPGQHNQGRVTRGMIETRLAQYTPEEREAVLELMLACKVAFKVRDQRTNEFKTDRLIPDLLEARVQQDNDRPEEILRWKLEVPFLSDRVLLRYIGERYEHVADPQVDCWRNRVEFLWQAKKGYRVRVTSELETPAWQKPFLTLEVAGSDHRTRDDIAGVVRFELAQHLCSEGLLTSHDELLCVEDNQTETLERWLQQFIHDNESRNWVDENIAVERHMEMSHRNKCDVKTLADYRKPSRARATLEDKTGGVDSNGYVWRRLGNKFLYLESSFHTPITPPKFVS